MYLIQKQKYKKYKEDEWFVLTNSIHQFLLNLDTSMPARVMKTESIVSNDYTVQYFESELNSYKDQNKTLKEMYEEQNREMATFITQRVELKQEIEGLKEKFERAEKRRKEAEKQIEFYKNDLKNKQTQIDNLVEDLEEMSKQSNSSTITTNQRRFLNESTASVETPN